ncbi:MAG: hypothetical protein EBX41_08520 [Chitinophagia bacterium]|nr:hypothetical protein [Chitinophagia bacterium]
MLNKYNFLLIALLSFCVTGTYAQKKVEGLNYTAAYNNNNYEDLVITYKDFYDNLAAFGQWMEDPNLGYVWIPDVENTFRPYFTNGKWVMTDYGNTWVSDYQWGWACFHYGRWTYDSYYGWIWVPGSAWAPAWVAWREGNGTLGWAPLTPGYEYDPKNIVEFTCPNNWWIFIQTQYLYADNYYKYWLGPNSNSSSIKHSTPIEATYATSNATFYFGPNADKMEKATGKKIPTYKMLTSNAPRRALLYNGLLKMFKPAEISKTAPDGDKIVPINMIKENQPISKTPQPIKVNATSMPEYKIDMQPVNYAEVIKVAENRPILPAPTPNKTPVPADNTIYASSVPVYSPEAQRQTKILTPKENKPLPPQNGQTPEPVNIPPRKDAAIPKPTQHADPLPEMRTTPKANSIIPKQKAEPIRIGD